MDFTGTIDLAIEMLLTLLHSENGRERLGATILILESVG